jgi:hypothetical protein
VGKSDKSSAKEFVGVCNNGSLILHSLIGLDGRSAIKPREGNRICVGTLVGGRAEDRRRLELTIVGAMEFSVALVFSERLDVD